MIFQLEALRAEAGDCLLLHYGDADEPRVIVIDGGPTKAVYKRLKTRLDELRDAAGLTERDRPLPIELLMVSHIDDDHIDGILHLTRQLIAEGGEPSYDVKSLWHNSFDDVIGNRAEDLQTSAHGGVEAASAGGDFFDQDLVQHDTALVLAGVNQGRTLRDNAAKLGLKPPLLVATADEKPRNFGDGLKLRLVGPQQAQVEALHKKWESYLKDLERKGKLDQAEAASFTDKSAANLASIVVIAEAGGKTMLLTGDARADYLMESLAAQGQLDDGGQLHVDLFKVPHHGSNRNVSRSTFRDITADHYVFSGDGHHGNPDWDTFEMIFGGREDAGLLDTPCVFHLTYRAEDYRPYKSKDYPLDKLEAVFDQARAAGHRFEIKAPATADVESVVIDLL